MYVESEMLLQLWRLLTPRQSSRYVASFALVRGLTRCHFGLGNSRYYRPVYRMSVVLHESLLWSANGMDKHVSSLHTQTPADVQLELRIGCRFSPLLLDT